MFPLPRDNILSVGTKQKLKLFKMELDYNSVLERFALLTHSLNTHWEVTVLQRLLCVVCIQLWTKRIPPSGCLRS